MEPLQVRLCVLSSLLFHSTVSSADYSSIYYSHYDSYNKKGVPLTITSSQWNNGFRPAPGVLPLTVSCMEYTSRTIPLIHVSPAQRYIGSAAVRPSDTDTRNDRVWGYKAARRSSYERPNWLPKGNPSPPSKWFISPTIQSSTRLGKG